MRFLMLVLLVCFLPFVGFSQNVKDKLKWEVSHNATDQEGEYKIIAKATLADGWHVFGQKPGDDFLIPTSFQFDSKGIQPIKIEELGTLKTETMEGVGTIHYYEKEVSFVATIRSMDKDIKGFIEFQVCNATMCLPPTQENFSFTIK